MQLRSAPNVAILGPNAPADFWKPILDPPATAEEWSAAARASVSILPEAAQTGSRDLDDLVSRVLTEQQFGPGHLRLSSAKRAYYLVKRGLPRGLTRSLRRAHLRVNGRGAHLRWPVEDRYVSFLRATLARLLAARGLDSASFLHFWPDGRRWALVLTHDVETAAGQALIPVVADIEERLGFRSSFNVVPERYPLDHGLLADLRSRGFEVGVHDLNHDGKLFNSEARFRRRADRINRHVRRLEASGFRAALTHREPEWMQALDIEYDLSFFDTDPFEPMPGGTMSIWPFQLGRFVELPYTLAQDYTLTALLRERTPRLWTEKTKFIAQHCGMVLLNTHPDYLRQHDTQRIYTEFLQIIRSSGGYWNALPAEVARWWRARAATRSPTELSRSSLALAHLEPAGLGGIDLRCREMP